MRPSRRAPRDRPAARGGCARSRSASRWWNRRWPRRWGCHLRQGRCALLAGRRRASRGNRELSWSSYTRCGAALKSANCGVASGKCGTFCRLTTPPTWLLLTRWLLPLLRATAHWPGPGSWGQVELLYIRCLRPVRIDYSCRRIGSVCPLGFLFSADDIPRSSGVRLDVAVLVDFGGGAEDQPALFAVHARELFGEEAELAGGFLVETPDGIGLLFGDAQFFDGSFIVGEELVERNVQGAREFFERLNRRNGAAILQARKATEEPGGASVDLALPTQLLLKLRDRENHRAGEAGARPFRVGACSLVPCFHGPWRFGRGAK